MLLVISLILGFLPGFAWLIFYLKEEETHAEPKRMIAFTFIAGMAFGFFTVIIEQGFNKTTGWAGVSEFSLVSLIGLALIEELMKFSAAHFAINKTPIVNDPLDVMIYMVVAALGFATLENIGAVSNIITAPASLIPALLETASLRFVGATLLHSLTSGIIGYHWALGITRKQVPHYLISGFGIAAALHATFNYLILNYGSTAYTVLFLMMIGFFVLNDFEKLKSADGTEKRIAVPLMIRKTSKAAAKQ